MVLAAGPEGIMKKPTPEGVAWGQVPTITAGAPDAKAGATPKSMAEAIVTTANLYVKIFLFSLRHKKTTTEFSLFCALVEYY
jgi:hypothetical protein